jgi:hypothetical protein
MIAFCWFCPVTCEISCQDSMPSEHHFGAAASFHADELVFNLKFNVCLNKAINFVGGSEFQRNIDQNRLRQNRDFR